MKIDEEMLANLLATAMLGGIKEIDYTDIGRAFVAGLQGKKPERDGLKAWYMASMESHFEGYTDDGSMTDEDVGRVLRAAEYGYDHNVLCDQDVLNALIEHDGETLTTYTAQTGRYEPSILAVEFHAKAEKEAREK